MRNPITHILLLVALCLWYHTQSTAGRRCFGRYIYICASNNKRSDINDVSQVTDLGPDVGRPDIHGAREEGRGGEERGGEGRGGEEREGDDLQRSEINDQRRQQLSNERQLTNIGNHQQRPAPLHDVSALDRLRAILGTRSLDVDDRGEEEGKREQRLEEDVEEPDRRNISGPDRQLILNETMTMLETILGVVENRLDADIQPASQSVSKK